jgi:hypothetical protein
MLRNCLALKGCWPLGTQGAIGLYGGYSDEAFARKGVWENQPLAVSDGSENRSSLEREKEAAVAGLRRSREWMKSNTSKLPVLAAMKMWSEMRPRGERQVLLFLLAIAGVFGWWRANKREAVLGLGIVAAFILSVAATYSDEGRFVIPVLPIILSFCAVGFWSVLGLARSRLLRRGCGPKDATTAIVL